MTWWRRFLSWFKPAPSPAPTPTPNPGGVKFTSQVLSIEPFSPSDMLDRHNAERRKNGVKPLVLDPDLTAYARSRADRAGLDHIAIQHIHDGFAPRPGDSEDGENAAIGAADAAGVMAGWMASDGHRKDILDSRHRRAGFGRSTDEQLITRWFAEFGG